jgi:hypothetical protein
MSQITLPAGKLKLILPIEAAFASNRQRAQSGSKRFKTAFTVLVLDAEGAVAEQYSANLDEQKVTLRYSPTIGGVERLYPKAAREIRRAGVERLAGLWLETRGVLTLELAATAAPDVGSAEA